MRDLLYRWLYQAFNSYIKFSVTDYMKPVMYWLDDAFSLVLLFNELFTLALPCA